MGFFKGILINAVLFVALAGLFAQTGWFYLSSFWAALVASLVLAVLNLLVKPFLLLLSLPINILTLGLFSFVINGLMLWLTSAVSETLGLAFNVAGFWPAFWGALVVTIVSAAVRMVIRPPRVVVRHEHWR